MSDPWAGATVEHVSETMDDVLADIAYSGDPLVVMDSLTQCDLGVLAALRLNDRFALVTILTLAAMHECGLGANADEWMRTLVERQRERDAEGIQYDDGDDETKGIAE